MATFRLKSFSLLLTFFFATLPSGYAQKSTDFPSQPSSEQASSEEKYSLPVAQSMEEYKAYNLLTELKKSEEITAASYKFLQDFSKSPLRFPVYQNLVTAHIKLSELDKAFEVGKKAITEYPDHLLVMTQLASIASCQALTGNSQFAAEGSDYAAKAMKFLESGTTPYGYKKQDWQKYRASYLYDVSYHNGVFAYLSNKPEEAAGFFLQALTIRTQDPYLFFLLAKVEVSLYEKGVANPLPIKQPETNRVVGEMSKAKTLFEQIVQTYAEATVLAELLNQNGQYRPLQDSISYDLQTLEKIMPTLKTEFMRCSDIVRQQTPDMVAKPPTVANSTDRP